MIKAIHYFSNAWAGNFWSGFHPKRVAGEFQQIKEDGFNTIILLLPWIGFQHDIETNEYSKEYLQRLRFLLKTAEQTQLKVMLRVSYPHYFCLYSTGNPRLRIERILLEPKIKKQWFAFLSLINNLAEQYSSFEYAFISWEDFWHVFTLFQQRPPEQRKALATNLGYDVFISSTIGLVAYNDAGIENDPPVNIAEDIDIPLPKSPRYKFYLDFINHQLNAMLDQARDYISPLLMEVRVDKDRYFDQQGEEHWYINDLQLDSGLPRLTYWAPFIGAKNEAEQLSAKQVMRTFSHTLDEITDIGRNTRHIINQFNFIDETPAFKGTHAEIAEDQLPEFMNGAANLLRTNSLGYGLWAYRDYYQNLLLNPAMSRGKRGWNIVKRGARFPYSFKKGRFLLLKSGAGIEQKFIFSERGVGTKWLESWHCLHFALETYPSPFSGSPTTAGIELTFAGKKPVAMEISDGLIRGSFDIAEILDAYQEYSFTISNTKGRARISMAYLYFYEFKNHIYDAQGKPSKHRDLIVQFNKDIEPEIIAEKPAEQ